MFDAIIELGKDAVYQFDFYEKLDALMEENSHPLCTFISDTINALVDYFIAGFPTSEMAIKGNTRIFNRTYGLQYKIFTKRRNGYQRKIREIIGWRRYC